MKTIHKNAFMNVQNTNDSYKNDQNTRSKNIGKNRFSALLLNGTIAFIALFCMNGLIQAQGQITGKTKDVIGGNESGAEVFNIHQGWADNFDDGGEMIIHTSTPYYKWNGNQYPDEDGISIFAQTNEILRLTDKATFFGNVGIGTNNPLIDLAIGDDDTGLKQVSDGNLAIYTNNVERFRVNDVGNVGIGTTNPLAKLHVEGGEIQFPGGSASNMATHFNWSGDGGNYIRGKTIIADDGGNVGIGTASPLSKLAVAGGVVIGSGYSGANAAPANGLLIEGNVGIGTTNPGNKLYVAANDLDGIRVASAGDQNFGIALIKGNGDGNSTTTYNGALESWWGIAFRSSFDNTVRHIFDTRTGDAEFTGTAKATSFVSSAASFPDYVFAANYPIMPLAILEDYVQEHSHLPNMPAEKEVVEQGLNLPEVITRSVENIEVIYLHLIELDKKVEALVKENAQLKQQVEKLR